MKKLNYAAHIYMIVGLVSGLYYREITNLNDFTGDSQLRPLEISSLLPGPFRTHLP